MLAALPLMQVWSAWMYDVYKRPGREVVFGQAFTRIMGVFLLASTAIVVFQDEVLGILGSATFAGAGAVIGTLVLAHFFMVLGNLLDGAFYVTRRTALKPYIAAASTFVMVLAYWLIIPRHGARGAAVATLIGFVFHCGLTLFVSRQVFRIKIEYAPLAVMLFLSTSIVLASRWLGSEVSVLPFKVLLVLAWPCVLWNTRYLLPQEREYVRHGLHQVVDWVQRGVPSGATKNELDESEEVSTLSASNDRARSARVS